MGESIESEIKTLLTVKEAAATLKYSPNKMYRIVKEGKIKALRFSHLTLIPKCELLRYIKR